MYAPVTICKYKSSKKKTATLQLMAQNYVINSFLKARECDAYMYLYKKNIVSNINSKSNLIVFAYHKYLF